MTPVTSDASQVEAAWLKKIISHIRRIGWQQVDHSNQNIMVFQGPNDDLGQPIQLVLPQSTHFWDSSILLAKAITLLAEVEEKTPEEITTAIQLESNVNKSAG